MPRDVDRLPGISASDFCDTESEDIEVDCSTGGRGQLGESPVRLVTEEGIPFGRQVHYVGKLEEEVPTLRDDRVYGNHDPERD